MDGAPSQPASEPSRTDEALRDTQGSLRMAQVSADHPDAASELAQGLGAGPFSLVCLLASPDAGFDTLVARAQQVFDSAAVMACTTAGELGREGYEDGQIIAVGFPADLFCVQCYAVRDLTRFDAQAEVDRLIQNRMSLASEAVDMASEFAFLMIDGLSMREEHLTAALSSGLGAMPLFGGSAGDGTRFDKTWLALNGEILQNAALLALVRSRCPVKVFSLDHLIPTDTRMVVTRADPDKRLVREINAEPAAKEYARLLGKDPHQLTPFTFAAHPVVVRLGETHHVRSIQRVDENGDLVFFSAINEGMVLTLADPDDIAAHLDAGLAALGQPDHILGCDCLLRRIEAGQVQMTREISDILRRHRVVGFSTYGEQIGALHVNQTLTGVAIYPPER